jgi:glycosyltransferase involved in cell wall biosynthesis
MNFLIISHALHYQEADKILAYRPYVREMNIWLKHVDRVEVLAPVSNDYDLQINSAYQHSDLILTKVPAFSLLNLKELLLTLLKVPEIIWRLFAAMKRADHIHLRCPGNLGLLGCMLQIFFPSKPKSAKYAGNWDPNARQPWSYNLQKWILKNTYLTKNMKVLVYGNWPNQTKNIKPFFTASYDISEIENLYVRNYTKPLHFCFVGSLSKGKRPDIALQLVEQLRKNGREAILHIYGDGELRHSLQQSIDKKNAKDWAFMYGNQPKEQIKKALKYSHFLILPSKSEGWPKAVAEAMFWGCIPISTPVSCVPWMLGEGERGILIDHNDRKNSVEKLQNLFYKPEALESISKNASEWSRQFTLDKFEKAISELLDQ